VQKASGGTVDGESLGKSSLARDWVSRSGQQGSNPFQRQGWPGQRGKRLQATIGIVALGVL